MLTMFCHPTLTLRSTHGITSVSHCGSHMLTTSAKGDLTQWDRQSGNQLSSWRPKEEDLVSALPLHLHGASSYNGVALQHKSGVCLFDLSHSSLTQEINVKSSNFARIRLLPLSSSLLLCPSGLSGITCHDLRLPVVGNRADLSEDATALSQSSSITALSIACDDSGSLQNFEPLPSLGPYHLVATYESGRVSIFDLRLASIPVSFSDACGKVEALPSLAVWKSVVLVGDSKGELCMFHVSGDSGMTLLQRSSICGYSSIPSVVGCLRIRDDGAITVACCWDHNICVLETRTLAVKAVLAEHRDSITDASFDVGSGHFVTSGLDGNAHVWDVFSDSYGLNKE